MGGTPEWLTSEQPGVTLAIRETTSLVEAGLDSLARIQLANRLRARLKMAVDEERLAECRTIAEVAALLSHSSDGAQARPAELQQQSFVSDERIWTASIADYRDLRGSDLLGRVAAFAQWQGERQDHGLWPYSRVLHSAPGTRAEVSLRGGESIDGINFASQDYLSLAGHPVVKAAAIEAVSRYGVHSAGSAALVGNTAESVLLEEELAEFLGFESITLYPTGWAAAYGVITALVRPTDHVVLDSLAHSSLQKGVEAATRNVWRTRHGSVDDAREALHTIRSKDRQGAILVVTEGLFSMDADSANLSALQHACREHDATLLVDVAHDFGALGPTGRGALEVQGMLAEVDLIMGSFSKTFASNGGFVACRSQSLGQYLRSFGSSHTFSNALSPAQVATIRAALSIVRSAEGAERRQRMMDVAVKMRGSFADAGLRCYGAPAPMVPLHLGSERTARLASRTLFQRGVHTNLVEFPAVPVGAARFRFQVQAEHDAEDFGLIARIVAETLQLVAVD